jgi:hypothetical protein
MLGDAAANDAAIEATASDTGAADAPGVDATSFDAGSGEDATSGEQDASVEAASGQDASQSPEAGDAASGIDASTGATLSGQVTASGVLSPEVPSSTLLPFRTVGIRDATGKVFTTSSDASGAFQVQGVTVPYDAVVYAGDPSGWPVVYLGLSTLQPRLGGSVDLPNRSMTLNVSVQFQDCGASTCQCSASYWFPALDSYVLAGCGVNPSSLTASLNPQMGWAGPATTTADLHILEWDPQGQHFWHAVASGITMQENQTVTVPQLAVVAVPTAGTVTVSATTPLPPSWNLQGSVGYAFPNNDGTALFEYQQALPFSFGVPDMAGGTESVSASIVDPASTGLYAAESWANAPVPLGTSSIALTVPPPATMTAPGYGQSLSVGGTMGWSTTTTGQVYSATLLPYVDGDAGFAFGNTEAQIITAGTSVDLAHLAELGVTLTAQSTWLQFRAYGTVASLDAIVDRQTLASPDGSVGSLLYVPFTLTP